MKHAEVDPPQPSTKLSTADALPTLAADRGTEPKRLTGLLRTELDWAVMKAIEKDRARRYETSSAFAADVQRYLAGEAVLAVPPSAGYRVRKFVRKNRGPVLTGGASAVPRGSNHADPERAVPARVYRPSICVWDVGGPEPMVVLAETEQYGVACHPDSRHIMVGRADRTLELIDLFNYC